MCLPAWHLPSSGSWPVPEAMPCPPGTPLHCCGNPLASWLLPIASHAFKRNFTAGSSRVYCTTCCVHWLLPLRAPLSTCHGYGNSLLRFDSQQVKGPALELGWLGGNGGRVPRPPPARPACPAGPVPRPGRHTGTAVEPAAAACAIPRNRPAVVFQFVSVDFTKLFHELVRPLFELVHYCRRELRPGKGPVEPYVSVKLATVTLSCSSELIQKIPRPSIGII